MSRTEHRDRGRGWRRCVEWLRRRSALGLGVAVGIAVGLAARAGHADAVRVALGALITAATVAVILAFNLLREKGTYRGRWADIRGTIDDGITIIASGIGGVVWSATLLPWLGALPGSAGGAIAEGSLAGVGSCLLTVAAVGPLILLRGHKYGSGSVGSVSRDEQTNATRLRPQRLAISKEDPFGGDLLGREEQVKAFCAALVGAHKPCVWSIEGPWGCGKSVFMEMCERYLEASGAAQVLRLQMLARESCGHPAGDLAISLARRLDATTSAEGSTGDRARHRAGVAALLDRLVDPRQLVENSWFGEGAESEAIGSTRDALGGYAAQMQLPLVVWLDELDRCEPAYAIGMLRAVHVLCAIPNVVTVLSINPAPLASSVAQQHGDTMLGERYLDRFIDRRVLLDNPQYEARGRERRKELAWTHIRRCALSGHGGLSPWVPHLIDALAEDRAVSVREIEQVIYHTAAAWGNVDDRWETDENNNVQTPSSAHPQRRIDQEKLYLAVLALTCVRVLDPGWYRAALTDIAVFLGDPDSARPETREIATTGPARDAAKVAVKSLLDGVGDMALLTVAVDRVEYDGGRRVDWS